MMGFGGVNLETLIGKDYWPSSVILNALVATAAQSVFSVLYLVYNGLFTSMTLGEEWSQYAVRRKGLRVSNPHGSLRGTYFLSLPYRYAIPVMVISATMHWIISQSIFLVGVEAYDYHNKRYPEKDFTTCGYSPAAQITGIIAGLLMLVYIMAFSHKKFKSRMPIAGSCSLAISDACHPADDGTSEPRNDPRLPL